MFKFEFLSKASHVRGVAIPSHGSDVDQFLDDLFMPVLDGNIDDGLSDARSLAASMKGNLTIIWFAGPYFKT